jgi:hypothetical protein
MNQDMTSRNCLFKVCSRWLPSNGSLMLSLMLLIVHYTSQAIFTLCLPFLVRKWLPRATSWAHVSFSLGSLYSSYYFGQFLTCSLWLMMARRCGLKLVLLVGLSSIGTLSLLLANTSSLAHGFYCCILLGALNSIPSTIQLQLHESPT